jgi:hypothetical protein
MRFCHSLDRREVTFDDDHLVANAGLMLPATLAQHLGLLELFDEHVDLGDAPGRAHVGHKAMTLIHSALAGGDSIDDADALRAGSTEAVLGHACWRRRRSAPSCAASPGGMPVSWTWCRGPVDQGLGGGCRSGRGAVHHRRRLLHPRDLRLAKEGGTHFTYNHVRGYNPLYAVAAGTGDVLHTRLRGGNAHSGRGAASFLTETFGRVRTAVPPGRSSCGPTPASTAGPSSTPVAGPTCPSPSRPNCTKAA